jgi:hypothetical protein
VRWIVPRSNLRTADAPESLKAIGGCNEEAVRLPRASGSVSDGSRRERTGRNDEGRRVAIAKRHHYLPEFYLGGFTDDGTPDGLFHVYFRRENTVRPMTPVNTGVIGHWNSITRGDGTKDPSIETWLSGMESQAVPGIVKLRQGNERLSADERAGVSQFIGFLWTRGPDFHKTLEDMNQVALESLERLAARHPPPTGVHPDITGRAGSVSLDELRAMAKDGRVELPREVSLRLMFLVANGIANAAMQATWMVCRAHEKSSFVTTDCPVMALPGILERRFYPRAPLDPEVPKIVALSSSTLLAFSGEAGARTETLLGQDTTRAYNVLLARRANDFVIARDELHVKNIVARARLAERGEKPRIFPTPQRTR